MLELKKSVELFAEQLEIQRQVPGRLPIKISSVARARMLFNACELLTTSIAKYVTNILSATRELPVNHARPAREIISLGLMRAGKV